MADTSSIRGAVFPGGEQALSMLEKNIGQILQHDAIIVDGRLLTKARRAQVGDTSERKDGTYLKVSSNPHKWRGPLTRRQIAQWRRRHQARRTSAVGADGTRSDEEPTAEVDNTGSDDGAKPTLTAADALRMKAVDLRAIIERGGPDAAVALAELERRRSNRKKKRAKASRKLRPKQEQRSPDAAPPPPPAIEADPGGWLPEPRRYTRQRRYTKKELSSIITDVFTGRAAPVRQLIEASRAFRSDLEAKLQAQGLPAKLVEDVIAGGGHMTYTGQRSDPEELFSVRQRARGIGQQMAYDTDESGHGYVTKDMAAQNRTVEGLATWWHQRWTGYEAAIRQTMKWWRKHSHVFDARSNLDTVLQDLRRGYDANLIDTRQAWRVLHDLHGLSFLERPDRQRGYRAGYTTVSDLLRNPGSPHAVTLEQARHNHAYHQAEEAKQQRLGAAAYHTGARQVAFVAAQLRQLGRKLTHTQNWRRRMPGTRIEVVRSHRGHEVVISGGAFDYTGRGGWRFIGPARPNKQDAFEALVEYAERVAGMPNDRPSHEYMRQRDMMTLQKGVRLDPPRTRPEEPDYPFAASLDYQGIQIDIETKKGQLRRGVDADGNQWSVRMPAHYGEIRGVPGADGDCLDVFVGEEPFAPYVWVIQTKAPRTKEFDETKCMLGFRTRAAALAAFKAAYSRPGFYVGCTKWAIGAFKAALARPSVTAGTMEQPIEKARQRLALMPGPAMQEGVVMTRAVIVGGRLLLKADRSHLVKKVITNKLGRRQTVWVNPNKGTKRRRRARAQPAASDPLRTTAAPASEDLREKVEELAADVGNSRGDWRVRSFFSRRLVTEALKSAGVQFGLTKRMKTTANASSATPSSVAKHLGTELHNALALVYGTGSKQSAKKLRGRIRRVSTRKVMSRRALYDDIVYAYEQSVVALGGTPLEENEAELEFDPGRHISAHDVVPDEKVVVLHAGFEIPGASPIKAIVGPRSMYEKVATTEAGFKWRRIHHRNGNWFLNESPSWDGRPSYVITHAGSGLGLWHLHRKMDIPRGKRYINHIAQVAPDIEGAEWGKGPTDADQLHRVAHALVTAPGIDSDPQAYRLDGLRAQAAAWSGANAADARPTERDENGRMEKAGGPYIGPRGGKWADPQRTIPWREGAHTERKARQEHERRPRRKLYHSSSEKLSSLGSSSFSVTDNAAASREYLEGEGGHLHEVHVPPTAKLANDKVILEVARGIAPDTTYTRGWELVEEVPGVIDELKSRGYEGIDIADSTPDNATEHRTITIFDPVQTGVKIGRTTAVRPLDRFDKMDVEELIDEAEYEDLEVPKDLEEDEPRLRAWVRKRLLRAGVTAGSHSAMVPEDLEEVAHEEQDITESWREVNRRDQLPHPMRWGRALPSQAAVVIDGHLLVKAGRVESPSKHAPRPFRPGIDGVIVRQL